MQKRQGKGAMSQYYFSFVLIIYLLVWQQQTQPAFGRTTSSWSSSSSSLSTKTSCPCQDVQLCEPISGPPVRSKEVYGFYGSWMDDRWSVEESMNWTHVTTVAWADKDPVMCLAHKHGARAVLGAPAINLQELSNQTARAVWIQNALSTVQNQFRDGIVFDYEEPQPPGSAQGHTYATLVRETAAAFHAANPSLQVSVCVPWSPDNIDGRAYPYQDLAAAADILYVMDYDTRSQIFDACIASANAPFPNTVRGLQRWFDLGIDPSMLVLGVPWYGYKYRCIAGTDPDAVYCPIEQVPFLGVNCSDAAGSEHAYFDLMEKLREGPCPGGLRRDPNMGAPFFNHLDDRGNVFQYWFDDPTSLREKYAWARQQGLRGVGPYVFNFLDPVHALKDAVAMWSALDAFIFSAPVGAHTSTD